MGFINAMIINTMNSISDSCFQTASALVNKISPDTMVTGSFSNLFGFTTHTDALFKFVKKISSTMVTPIADAILVLVIMMELYKICGKVDANATIPLFKEMVILMVYFAIFSLLITNATTICNGIYDLINNYIIQPMSGALQTKDISMSVALGTIKTIDVAARVLMMASMQMVITVIAFVVALAMSYARALQIYCLTAFAPIPFALLGFEETRSWGSGYIKNFAAICLAGAILMFLLLCFPLLVRQVVSDLTITASGSTAINVQITWMLDVLKIVALDVMLILGLIKSGSWARDVLGG
jgi:hypothetical protein